MTLEALSANATLEVADQAGNATAALAESAALNATDMAAPAAQALADQTAGAPSSALDAANTTLSAPGAAPTLGIGPSPAPMDPAAADAIMGTGHSLLGTALVTAAYLCLILGAIFLAVWLLRRYGPSSIARPKGRDNPKLIGRLMIGPKQSVCVVRVHERNLVLGVTEERINLLAETETPAGRCYEDEDEDEFTRFAETLAQKRTDTADDE